MASLIDVAHRFRTETDCLDYIESLRWPSGVCCVRCGSLKVAKAESTVKNRKTGETVKVRRVYDCLEAPCGHQFSPTSGTIFHDSHLPLTKWFMAVALMIDAKKSLSALQMKRHLGIGSYKTAWHLNHRIREAMEQPGGMFSGTTEVDETFIGGKLDKRRKNARAGRYGKQAVVGIVQRGTNGKGNKVVTKMIPAATKAILVGYIRERITSDAATINTDSNPAYHSLGKHGWLHEAVNHVKGEYARGEAHINTLESFWGLFKRGIVGSFHSISVKHMPRYLDEFSFRFSNQNEDLFGLMMDGLTHGEPLPMKKLVSEQAS